MSETGKTSRLSKVAKEFNQALQTIVDTLATKGVVVEANPNTKIDENTYQILLNEFRSEKNEKEQSNRITIQQKESRQTVSVEEEQEAQEETTPTEETIVEKEIPESTKEVKVEKENTEEGIKVVGKIDLDSMNLKSRPDKKAKKTEDVKEFSKEKTTPAEEIKEKKQFVEEPPREIEEMKLSADKLEGPKVLGKIDLPIKQEKEKKKRPENNQSSKDKKKRARITKRFEAVDAVKDFVEAKKDFQKVAPKDKKFDKKPNKPGVSGEEVSSQIKETLSKLSGTGKSLGSKHRKQKRQAFNEQMQKDMEDQEAQSKVLKVTEFATVSQLATMMSVNVNDVISACMSVGLFVSINQRLDAENMVLIANEFGFEVEFVSAEAQESVKTDEPDKPEDLVPRSPIVTVMGHVDHGKTSLLDYVRKANVIAGEAGGITQHIGAYSVVLENGKKITFLDTPGHEAFTAMRARGAQVTDIAIIVIAADDSVMPQTVEAINHAQAAGVPMIFAINKIDKPGANPEKIREKLAGMNLLVEEWGGKYQSQEIAAKSGLNVELLLEKVLLEAELLELKANPNKNAEGTVIESALDKGRGYVSTILVQAGTLKMGDVLLAGCYSGKVKAMYNERGQKITQAGPATPVSILGLDGAPSAGDRFNVFDDEKEARTIATKRLQLQREQGLRTKKHITLDEIGRRIAIGSFKELNIIVKGDVDGSIEALADSLQKLSTNQIIVNIIHKSVGQISESDVMLAAASDAIIVGFQVRPSTGARKVAETEEIEIRLYSIIYDAIEEIKLAMEGMLEAKIEEKIIGTAEIREVFKITKVGTVAGCMVLDGKIIRSNKVRVIRDGIVVYSGELGSLKRFKDDVKEVTSGYDCGLNVSNFNDIKTGDIIEAYEEVEIKQKL